MCKYAGTNDVQGVHVCAAKRAGTYHVFCNYVGGCNATGCGYQLTGPSVNHVEGMLSGAEIKTITDIEKYERIKVYDNYNVVVSDEIFNSKNLAPCVPATGM